MQNMIKIKSKTHPNVVLKAIPGHFVTPNSHVNYFLDMTPWKSEELTRAGIYSMNSHKTIYIITPEYVNSGQMVFRENFHGMIKDKNVLLLLASATTGQTIIKATQGLRYYGASISGISAVFSAANSIMGIPIKSLFSIVDIPDYKAYDPEGCSMCKDGTPIDAFANAYGYSRIG